LSAALSSGCFSTKYWFKNVLTKERATGARRKASSPCTLNPGTRTDANQKHRPLTTIENAPKLKKLSGRDKADRIGFTDELTNPIEIAAIKAAGNVAILTPGTAKSTRSRLSAVAIQVKNIPIISFFLNFSNRSFSYSLSIYILWQSMGELPLYRDRFHDSFKLKILLRN
jgi:hypothetical protein